jgi:hypothetical protein
MKKTVLALALLAVIGTANATDKKEGNTTINTTNQGGTGGIGYGGSGGNSNATAISTGGAAYASGGVGFGGTSNVDVRNSSTNVNGNSNTNKVENSSLNVQGQTSEQAQKQNQSTNNANNSTNSVVVEGDSFEARRIPVNTAFAPSIAPTANCALSVSGGISTIGFSGSFGKAYIDQNCATNEDIRNVALVLGDKETAEQMKCITSETYRKARAAMNRHCAVEQE